MKLVVSMLMAIVFGTASIAQADDLPRRPWFGARLETVPDGVRVVTVETGGSASDAGIVSDDILLTIDGDPVRVPADVRGALADKSVGRSAHFLIKRAGRELEVAGRLRSAPLETYPGATVRYGAVRFGDNLLRDVMVEPIGVEHPPVVFIIQGYTCGSIEGGGAGAVYPPFVAQLVAAGVAVYRIEKPGVGDSRGPLACRDEDFATELSAFRVAYRGLVARGVSRDRIFFFGHSLGGLEAPLLAAESSPRGVAVYGTVVRNWADYVIDLDRIQDLYAIDADPAKTADRAEADRDAVRAFFFQGKSLAAIAAANPALKQNLIDLFGWDGTRSFGRSEQFARDLAALKLVAAWRDTKSAVLSLYGGSDVIAINGEDQKTIADIVNHYRPGTASYVEVPDTMHLLDLVGDRATLRKQGAATGQIPRGTYNPKIGDELIAWIRRVMAAPATG